MNKILQGMMAAIVYKIKRVKAIFVIPAGIEIACRMIGIKRVKKTTPAPYRLNHVSDFSRCLGLIKRNFPYLNNKGLPPYEPNKYKNICAIKPPIVPAIAAPIKVIFPWETRNPA